MTSNLYANSFDFLNQIRSLFIIPNCCMASFDVTFLFAQISFLETLDICISLHFGKIHYLSFWIYSTTVVQYARIRGFPRMLASFKEV